MIEPVLWRKWYVEAQKLTRKGLTAQAARIADELEMLVGRCGNCGCSMSLAHQMLRQCPACAFGDPAPTDEDIDSLRAWLWL
jgi:Zn finger protein HypA/HybF involved in hydrogenase expression